MFNTAAGNLIACIFMVLLIFFAWFIIWFKLTDGLPSTAIGRFYKDIKVTLWWRLNGKRGQAALIAIGTAIIIAIMYF